MSEDFELDGLSRIFQTDSYQSEAESFVEDVHLLILDTLRAAGARLNEEASKENSELLGYFANANGENAERLAQDQADLWMGIARKKRFLRNQALVSLMSRLTHSLLIMGRSAEVWTGPKQRKKSDADESRNDGGSDEFKKIWRDYRERCGLDLGPKYIGFVDRYRSARNRIVHSGAEANPYLPFDEADHEAGIEGMLNRSFSKKYPEFVHGESFRAEIDVTDELLEKAVQLSVSLVRYVSEQLRLKELEYANDERLARYRAETPQGELPC